MARHARWRFLLGFLVATASGLAAASQAETVGLDATHWAFQPVSRPHVPKVRDGAWSRNPIDTFVSAQHAERGLTPTPLAPKHVLLRRVYIDLIGLPPTREQLHAFLNDKSPDAYEKVVDTLLASPHYGERWGRHWMDVWRYSDWYGYKNELRNSQRHIWRWRDWIIESLNDDTGYDRMVTLMLAADEVAPDDMNALRATGYLARNYYKFNRHVWLDDTVEHTGKAFLGLTFNCARCHDHKYDPMPQVDYFRLRAFFEPHQVRTDHVPGQTDVNKDGLPRVYDAAHDAKTYLFIDGDDKRPDKDRLIEPGVPAMWKQDAIRIKKIDLPPAAWYPGLQSFAQEEALASARAEVKAKRIAADKANDVTRAQLAAAEAKLAAVEARIAADKARYGAADKTVADDLAKAANKAERVAALRAAEASKSQYDAELAAAQQAIDKKPDDAKAKKRLADLKKKLPEIEKRIAAAQKAYDAPPATSYAVFGKQYPKTSTGRRAALAGWIANRNNPLTARVAVNHIWLRHFGQPLVPTVFDFGLNGKPPTQPLLLDYLAHDLMADGWRMKRLHKLIVMSRTYRAHSSPNVLSPTVVAQNRRVDPDNRYLWRANTRRVEGEVVRDSLLRVTGNLDATLGGPEIDQNKGLTTFRRSVYYRHAHEKYMTFLKTFDAPNIVECYKRDETLIPQQGLALFNSRLAIDQSRHLAARLTKPLANVQKGLDRAFIVSAFESVLSRPPSDEEVAAATSFLSEQTELFKERRQLTPFVSGGKSTVAASSDPRQRARENLVHVLFNHNDFVTVR